MKKNKILTLLSSLPMLSLAISPITSCKNKGGGGEESTECTITISPGEHGNLVTEWPGNNSYNETISFKQEKGLTWDFTYANACGFLADMFVIPDEGYYFKEWQNEDGTTLDDSFIVNKNLNAKAIFEAIPVILTDWDTIIAACNVYEKSDKGPEATATFLSNFTIQGKSKLTSLDDLIGAQTHITINGKDHLVRIIGTNHDTGYSALTFELVTLLSDSSGNGMTSIWDKTNNHTYYGSVLRKNLTGEGSASGEGVWTTPAINMLPTNIKSALKQVYKKTAQYNLSTSSWYIYTGYDKLFPLTFTEMAGSAPYYYIEEGKPYDYWTYIENKPLRYDDILPLRKKKDVNGNSLDYWLSSPNIASDDFAYSVWGKYGTHSTVSKVTEECGVSFGFCI